MTKHATDRYAFLSATNATAVKDYLTHDRNSGFSSKTFDNHESALLMFFHRLPPDVEFKSITMQDIEKALDYDKWKPSTKEIVKQSLRQLLMYHHRQDLADQIKMNPKVMQSTTKTREDCLTEDEIQRLINASLEPQMRAIIEVLITSGCRIDELRNLRVGSVVFEGATVWLNIRVSKTLIRRVPLVVNSNNPCSFFPKNLESWVLSHPMRDNPEAPLFYSRYRDKAYYGKPMSTEGIRVAVKRVAKEAGIQKRVCPHILRHTSATYFGETLNENMMCTKFGWTIGSPMARVYCHVNERSLEKVLLENAGIEKGDDPRRRELLENQQLKARVEALEQMMGRIWEKEDLEFQAWCKRKDVEKQAYQQYKSEIFS